MQVLRSYLDPKAYEASTPWGDNDGMDGMFVTKEIQVDHGLTVGEFINMVEPGAVIFKHDVMGWPDVPMEDGDFFGNFAWYSFTGPLENLWNNDDGKALKILEEKTVFTKGG